ncbi:carbohydrate-binding protein [Symbiopectobacterium sp. Eva_TO]
MAVIQSYARATYRVIFNARDMLQVIERSGSRQAEGQGIGVRPNVAAALTEVDNLLSGAAPLPPFRPWQVGVQYLVGDRVSYDGLNYICIQQHIAHAITWRPPQAPTLWRRI